MNRVGEVFIAKGTEAAKAIQQTGANAVNVIQQTGVNAVNVIQQTGANAAEGLQRIPEQVIYRSATAAKVLNALVPESVRTASQALYDSITAGGTRPNAQTENEIEDKLKEERKKREKAENENPLNMHAVMKKTMDARNKKLIFGGDEESEEYIDNDFREEENNVPTQSRRGSAADPPLPEIIVSSDETRYYIQEYKSLKENIPIFNSRLDEYKKTMTTTNNQKIRNQKYLAVKSIYDTITGKFNSLLGKKFTQDELNYIFGSIPKTLGDGNIITPSSLLSIDEQIAFLDEKSKAILKKKEEERQLAAAAVTSVSPVETRTAGSVFNSMVAMGQKLDKKPDNEDEGDEEEWNAGWRRSRRRKSRSGKTTSRWTTGYVRTGGPRTRRGRRRRRTRNRY